ncbi:unnamed protein product [Caenorhabditis angaria]|uniref:Uncharacterized protein n=1 Tax=Caenorhabditis angaria TaxID=860376 RepID=A0A9P1IZ43_9PELO|nr:unnamed protein product [Caenorhabditis angaria]
MKFPDVSAYDNLIGGFCGGVASTLVCHPFDLLKIRFSANEGNLLRPQYTGYLDAVRRICKIEGFRGLYQGLTPSILGSSISWGLYFQWYYVIKNKLGKTGSEEIDNLICGFLSGSAVMCITNPIWLTKTRLCLQYENQTTKKFDGMIDCMKQTVKNEGFQGLYRGFVPGIIGTTHGSIQFAAYNWMKDKRCQMLEKPKDSYLAHSDYLVFSAVSKIAATTMTFPYQVLRTRMQDHNTINRGIWQITRDTLKYEGISGLWKGCIIANIRQLPAAIVTFVTYENVKRLCSSTKRD